MDLIQSFIFSKTLRMRIFTPALLSLLLISCATSKYSSVGKEDQARLTIDKKDNVIDFASLQRQDTLTFADRKTRGIFAPMLGQLTGLGVDAIKKMIAKDKAKYTAEYKLGKTDMAFYDQISTRSAFDPIGIQFNGFTIARTFTNEAGGTDTALVATFEVDKSNVYEIMNNSIFRLKVKDFKLYSAKAKIAKSAAAKLNMDFEITFKTSYVNEMGVLFDNITLGKFVFTLRDAPLDQNAPGYADYYNNLKGKSLDGRSFIVPRSFGYYISDGNEAPEKSFSQGLYSIQVKVTESSKNTFINTLLIDNSDQIINAAGKKVQGLAESADSGKEKKTSKGKN
jgi:hypothetical protein